MALLLSDILTAIRDTSASFSKRNVTDGTLARFLTGEQRRLISRALVRDKQYLAQQCSIVFDVDSANAPGTAGAGTTGGVPGQITSGETLAVVQSPVGSAVEIDSDDDDAEILVSASVVASATSTTLTKTAAGWTVDAYANQYVRITAGTGEGQQREITSNTSDTLTVGTAWETTPDTTSIFEIVDPVIEVDEDVNVITAIPAERTKVGYLVKLNAQGVAYLDLSTPLVATYDVGIPLPSHHYLLPDATVRYGSTESSEILSLVSYAHRLRCPVYPAAYVLNQELYLCGDATAWSGATSIDLRYVPIAPAFTARTDFFLLPDSAYGTLVGHGAAFCAEKVSGLGIPVPSSDMLRARAVEAEGAFMETISHGRRGRTSRVRETW